MNIITALETATTSAGIGELSFAQLQEFNAFLDSFNPAFFADPTHSINVIVPPPIVSTFGSGHLVKQVMQLQGWVLTRLKEDTNNYRSASIEPTYIQPMRELANKFIKKLWQNEALIDEEVTTIQATIRPEYGFLNYKMFGVSYSVNVPLAEAVC